MGTRRPEGSTRRSGNISHARELRSQPALQHFQLLAHIVDQEGDAMLRHGKDHERQGFRGNWSPARAAIPRTSRRRTSETAASPTITVARFSMVRI